MKGGKGHFSEPASTMLSACAMWRSRATLGDWKMTLATWDFLAGGRSAGGHLKARTGAECEYKGCDIEPGSIRRERGMGSNVGESPYSDDGLRDVARCVLQLLVGGSTFSPSEIATAAQRRQEQDRQNKKLLTT